MLVSVRVFESLRMNPKIILFYFIMFLTIGPIGALLYFVYYNGNRAPFIIPVYAQMSDFYMLPEPEPEQPNMAVQGEAVSRQATESMKVVSSTMEGVMIT
jgi:hypothetical protein